MGAIIDPTLKRKNLRPRMVNDLSRTAHAEVMSLNWNEVSLAPGPWL